MNFEIVKLIELSGEESSIYSIFVEELGKTLFDLFIEKNEEKHSSEIDSILDKIEVIAHETGARETFFKLKEGKPGDGVCALFDTPNHHLRIYCIRYGMDLIILGGGGLKARSVRAWQEDKQLKEAAEWMIKISQLIFDRQQEGDITFGNSGRDFFGDLKFSEDE